MDPDCFVDAQVDTNDYTIRSLKQTHTLITHVFFDRILFLFVDDPVSSSFFSSTETAFASLNQFKIKVKAEAGSKTAKLILKTCDPYIIK